MDIENLLLIVVPRQHGTAKTTAESFRRVSKPSDRYVRIANKSTSSKLIKPELSTLVTARQKLESQQQENKSVQDVSGEQSCLTLRALVLTCFQEFAGLADDANIYKLVGPVLLKQDTAEAKSTVDGRLQYIETEM